MPGGNQHAVEATYGTMPLCPLSNLNIELERPAEVSPGSEIYAKVIGAVDTVPLH
jgi:hypothetical protein